MMDKYKATLQELRQDLATLLDEQTGLLEEQELIADQLAEKSRSIKRVEETLMSVARLCGVELTDVRLRLSSPGMSRLGLTPAIREAMKDATGWMTARDVRQRMLENKFDDGKYDNLLASIHVTLKRLAKSGELVTQETDGKTEYKLNPEYVPRIERMSAVTIDPIAPATGNWIPNKKR